MNPQPYSPYLNNAPALRPAKRTNYAGGRKRLSAEKIEANRLYEAERSRQRSEERAAEKLRRQASATAARLLKNEKQYNLHLLKAARERSQCRLNKNQTVMMLPVPASELVIAGSARPSGVLQVCDAPGQKGYTNVRIDGKTVIEVKNGRDIAEAVAAYKNKHALA